MLGGRGFEHGFENLGYHDGVGLNGYFRDAAFLDVGLNRLVVLPAHTMTTSANRVLRTEDGGFG